MSYSTYECDQKYDMEDYTEDDVYQLIGDKNENLLTLLPSVDKLDVLPLAEILAIVVVQAAVGTIKVKTTQTLPKDHYKVVSRGNTTAIG